MKHFVDKTYNVFASLIAFVLLLGAMAVVVIATASFLDLTADVLLEPGLDVPYSRLQTLFDLLLGGVIALELTHSVHLMVTRREGYSQLRSVLMIGLLAVVRKLIVIELGSVSGLLLVGLAAAVVALGGAYAALVWAEYRLRQAEPGPDN